MTRQVLYVACPLRPSEEEISAQTPTAHYHNGLGEIAFPIPLDDGTRVLCAQAAIRANLNRALRWLRWLTVSFPETTFIAPWICNIMSGADDTDPVQRESGMLGNLAVIERCDGIVLCGPRLSEGMRREMEHARENHHVRLVESGDLRPGFVFDVQPSLFGVYDLTWCGNGEPPTFPPGQRPTAQNFIEYMRAMESVKRQRDR